MRLVFAGTPAFAVPALRAVAGSKNPVVGVLTQPDRPSGRGRKITFSAVKEAAMALQIPVAQPVALKTAEGRAQIGLWQPDVMIVVAYGLILPREVLAIPPLGCINIHASLLPRWRGAAPIQRAILAGDRETGISIMQMDAGLDTGPILLQRRAVIGTAETGGQLQSRLAELGASALLEALDLLERDELRSEPQPLEGVSYASKIEKSEALIDWCQDASVIARKVRAFEPWPATETRFEGDSLRILSAQVDETGLDSNAGHKAPIDSDMNQSGRILSLVGDAMRVRCGTGSLLVSSVQRPGKRPVLAREFVAGADALGKRLG
jgi:methionyl-tRNA formyltransferase